MRLFLAINLPLNIKQVLAQELPCFDYLKFRLIPPENWHITLKFIGEVDAALVPIIREAIKPVVNQFTSFDLTIKDIGFLNHYIFAFDCERSPKLYGLFRIIDDRLSSRGIVRPENREFRTHITVGRMQVPINSQLHSVRHFDLKTREPVSFPVESVDLMESELTPQGAVYKIVEKFILTS
ncbi:MAG: RNA 2',3'-cyclic phosphodiesterase [Patescibacteria group bacterium]